MYLKDTDGILFEIKAADNTSRQKGRFYKDIDTRRAAF